ncbi:hypothetical protein BVC93_17345 [Mycobacterium sp. MS1601]|nr:hypothetical protein BVC93_17345 [Mycobacterium sp. MS1601]
MGLRLSQVAVATSQVDHRCAFIKVGTYGADFDAVDDDAAAKCDQCEVGIGLQRAFEICSGTTTGEAVVARNQETEARGAGVLVAQTVLWHATAPMTLDRAGTRQGHQ